MRRRVTAPAGAGGAGAFVAGAFVAGAFFAAAFLFAFAIDCLLAFVATSPVPAPVFTGAATAGAAEGGTAGAVCLDNAEPIL